MPGEKEGRPRIRDLCTEPKPQPKPHADTATTATDILLGELSYAMAWLRGFLIVFLRLYPKPMELMCPEFDQDQITGMWHTCHIMTENGKHDGDHYDSAYDVYWSRRVLGGSRR